MKIQDYLCASALTLPIVVAALWSGSAVQSAEMLAVPAPQKPITSPTVSDKPVENSSKPATEVQPMSVDIFAIKTWLPPAPRVVEQSAESPQTAPKPAPKPEAPPLPFRFVGKIIEPGKAVAFLIADGDRVISVSVGNTIRSLYYVEKHDNNRLYFIYKPLKVRQSISVGSES